MPSFLILSRRVMISLVILLALPALFYFYFLIFFVRVRNESGQTLTNVQLLIPGNPWDIGIMPPGDSRWLFIEPKADDRLALSFATGGQPHRAVDKDIYMGFSGGDGVIVTVQPSLRVKFERKSFIP